ncbi:MAG: TraR/DksA family transcriptional regulator [Candidatus Magasanikiibacteriota bacterium]
MTKTKFTKTFLDEIKKNLLEEKIHLESELEKFAKKNSHAENDYDTTFPEYGDEEDENAREVADYTANKPLEISLENTLRDVVKSLKRLEDNTYGFCKYCDNPIEEKRLLARPTSSACVSCKKTLTQEA